MVIRNVDGKVIVTLESHSDILSFKLLCLSASLHAIESLSELNSVVTLNTVDGQLIESAIDIQRTILMVSAELTTEIDSKKGK